MDVFYEGISVDQRWRNEMLKAQIETNRLLNELILIIKHQESVETIKNVKDFKQKRPYNRRDKGVVNE